MEPTPARLPTRRKFLRRTLWGTAALAGVAGTATGYGFWEASQIRVRRLTVALPNLPPAFAGKTVAVLADFHHGPFVSMDFIRGAVAVAQALAADAYALVGDFAHKGTHTTEQLPPCLEAVSALTAPLGVFAVPGNHDMQHAGRVYRDEIRKTPLTDLTNRSVRLTAGGEELWFAGVDDLWWGKPDLTAALLGVPAGAAVVLLAHNPDYAEAVRDPRVGLMLSGHTHGGQVYLPGLGAGWMPSRFGDKYRGGLVEGPAHQVFVSRGLGEAGVPVRLNCPPEINVLTLTAMAPREVAEMAKRRLLGRLARLGPLPADDAVAQAQLDELKDLIGRIEQHPPDPDYIRPLLGACGPGDGYGLYTCVLGPLYRQDRVALRHAALDVIERGDAGPREWALTTLSRRREGGDNPPPTARELRAVETALRGPPRVAEAAVYWAYWLGGARA